MYDVVLRNHVTFHVLWCITKSRAILCLMQSQNYVTVDVLWCSHKTKSHKWRYQTRVPSRNFRWRCPSCPVLESHVVSMTGPYGSRHPNTEHLFCRSIRDGEKQPKWSENPNVLLMASLTTFLDTWPDSVLWISQKFWANAIYCSCSET